jgi:putative ABC transport system permease protein
MISNNLKIAFRSITRSKGYSVINIAGLAVGMSVTMLIGMWVYDELSFDHYHKNFERIGEVYQHQRYTDGLTNTAQAPGPVGSELKANYHDDFKTVVRMWWPSAHSLSIGDQRITQSGTFMDAEAPEMFSFRMIRGTTDALKDQSSVIISETTAKGLFGEADPMEKMIRLDNALDLKVAGVYEDIPANSTLHPVQFLGNWEFWVASNYWMRADENNWKNIITTYVELQPNSSFAEVSSKIAGIKKKHLTADEAARENPELFIQPMTRWHLYSEWKNGEETQGRIQFVWLFTIIGVFVLLLACINFMNLSTAQSEKRAKEVGIRKSIGSARWQLIYQFFSESLLVVFFSWAIALAAVGFMLPWFNELAGKEMSVPYASVTFWLVSAAFILLTSILSGSYPALFLSSFQPVKVLKGTFKAGRFASIPRKALVVLQFTVSITLIIGTIIVWQQIQYAKNRPIGYDREGLITIRKLDPSVWRNANTLMNEMKASGAAIDVAESAAPPTSVWYQDTGFEWRGKDPNIRDEFVTMGVAHDYGRTMGWKFIDGRDFSREYSTDSSGIVLNEAAAEFMRLESPVGEEITWKGRKYKVLGVIADMVMTSPYDPVQQTIFHLDYSQSVWINVRLNPEMSASESLGKIEQVYKKIVPSVTFDYKFADEEYALKFRAEERVGKLASFFASLAIFISCMGLFGMASFVAEQRKKEIGIRKILGASVVNLWRMLSIEFLVLVAISCVIGMPIAWNYLDGWLQKYEYHTEISIWVFIGSTAGALLITLLTVSFQTIKASIVNPINSLRSE